MHYGTYSRPTGQHWHKNHHVQKLIVTEIVVVTKTTRIASFNAWFFSWEAYLQCEGVSVECVGEKIGITSTIFSHQRLKYCVIPRNSFTKKKFFFTNKQVVLKLWEPELNMTCHNNLVSKKLRVFWYVFWSVTELPL